MWSDRQVAMLRAIGVRLWQPPVAKAPAEEAVEVTPAPVVEVAPPAPVTPPLRPEPRPAARPSQASPPPPPAVVELGAVSGLDWQPLREAVAGCTACALSQSRTQTVFGVGHPQAHWMIVGEAPGEQEDLRGEPFVGPAGQLLDAMLRALSMSREAEGEPAQRVYIANTLKCRPPRNRNPAPEELQRCEPFLVRQIELVKPRIILAMGRFAVQALLRSSEPIGKLRGRVHRYQGVPLVVTYHPAYLLRNLPDKARAWDDLCLAAAVAERAGAGLSPRA
ncbi:uracil-DNA glycosylase [Rubrivivax gelatinosus]|uniref:Type-4 uracil-DNA glycosylase n=1 Tax=Rubrivivax gelatinosus (strain NBRC 100245 / IL144) TaxID=983917 RepID=I0HLD6_RUBGI|nr:uracil-DNA glycosylase [Rubrivivax gelatinosus]BAL93823.1 putative uracil-DNA glycosylase superfamily protein [Rubrivivax gelatinosus IL144]